jgi:hypothetical protein
VGPVQTRRAFFFPLSLFQGLRVPPVPRWAHGANYNSVKSGGGERFCQVFRDNIFHAVESLRINDKVIDQGRTVSQSGLTLVLLPLLAQNVFSHGSPTGASSWQQHHTVSFNKGTFVRDISMNLDATPKDDSAATDAATMQALPPVRFQLTKPPASGGPTPHPILP